MTRDECVRMVRTALMRAGVAECEIPPTFEADVIALFRKQLRYRVIANLLMEKWGLSQADDGARIEVSRTRRGREVYAVVSRDGIAIFPSKQAAQRAIGSESIACSEADAEYYDSRGSWRIVN
jgi:hypothetical protein